MLIERRAIVSEAEDQQSGLSVKDLYLSLLREGKPVFLSAWGMSMYPFVKNGDRIKVEPIKGEINIGDIIAVIMKNENGPWFFVHRVVKIDLTGDKKTYFTKGDANKCGLDEPLAAEQIAGKVTLIERDNFKIQLGSIGWRRFSSFIAGLSFKHPQILKFLSRWLVLIIEWKLFPIRINNRIKKFDPVSYNTEELLLLCSRKNLNEDLKSRATAFIVEGVDWQKFSDSAMRNGVTALVYNSLKELSFYARVPDFALTKLKSAQLYIMARSTLQHQELLGILKVFSDEHIPVLSLKGTLLSERLYGDIAARSVSVDLDLLVESKDKERAKCLLEKNGYKCAMNETAEISPWQCDFNKAGCSTIDLHWDITMMCRSKLRECSLWEGVLSERRNEIKILRLKEEELLLYLCAHLANSSCFRQLRYVCDINALLAKYEKAIDWGKLIKKAKLWKLSSSLYACLRLSNILFGQVTPSRVLDELRPGFLKPLLIKIFVNKETLLRSNLRRKLIDKFLSYIFFELIEAKTIEENLAVFNRVFFPPKETMEEKNHVMRILKGLSKIPAFLFQ